jgi:hypothetical protein
MSEDNEVKVHVVKPRNTSVPLEVARMNAGEPEPRVNIGRFTVRAARPVLVELTDAKIKRTMDLHQQIAEQTLAGAVKP